MNVELYNKDCMSVMEGIPDHSIDLIVTDPPYLITSRGNAGTTGGMLTKQASMKGRIFSHNDINCSIYLPEFYRLLKEDSHCYIMCNHINLIDMLNEATKVGFHFIKSLVWDKGNKIMGRAYMSQFEYILFFRKEKFKIVNNCSVSDIIHIPNKKSKGADGKNLHDTEKPVELMEILVSQSSNGGDIVLDPFMGIGSTGIACIRQNRDFMGCEIDTHYFNIAKNRIKDSAEYLGIDLKGLK